MSWLGVGRIARALESDFTYRSQPTLQGKERRAVVVVAEPGSGGHTRCGVLCGWCRSLARETRGEPRARADTAGADVQRANRRGTDAGLGAGRVLRLTVAWRDVVRV